MVEILAVDIGVGPLAGVWDWVVVECSVLLGNTMAMADPSASAVMMQTVAVTE